LIYAPVLRHAAVIFCRCRRLHMMPRLRLRFRYAIIFADAALMIICWRAMLFRRYV